MFIKLGARPSHTSLILRIVLFKSLRNIKRRNKGNFMSNSNSNMIKLCGGGGQHYLILIRF